MRINVKTALMLCIVLLQVTLFSFDIKVIHSHLVVMMTAAFAEDDWKKEFEEVCAKTQDAMTMTSDELRALIERCDRLKPLIEKLDGTERKFYLKRLEMCREFFAFTLSSKEAGGQEGQ